MLEFLSEENGVVIRDIVVTAIPSSDDILNPAGEFEDDFAQANNQTVRVMLFIQSLFAYAVNEHKTHNFNRKNKIKGNKKNHITRLTTNEFSFYTKAPLSLKTFNEIKQKIIKLAKNNLKNLHIVLSSFAVKTKNNEIMNVVVKVTCGQNAELRMIVKNSPSEIDPVYSEVVSGKKSLLVNVEKKLSDDELPPEFSFNNVMEFTTFGEISYFECIDICLDHMYGVAKDNLIAHLKTRLLDFAYKYVNNLPLSFIPMQCSQIVTSNTIDLVTKNVVGQIIHADHDHDCRANLQIEKSTTIAGFGTKFDVKVMAPILCDKINKNVELEIFQIENTQISFLKAIEIINSLIGKINTNQKIEQQGELDFLLLLAAQAEKAELVEQLIKKGVNINSLDKFNQTPLLRALKDHDIKMVKLLIQKGADIHIADNVGYTPLRVALKEQHLQIIPLLIGDLIYPDNFLKFRDLLENFHKKINRSSLSAIKYSYAQLLKDKDRPYLEELYNTFMFCEKAYQRLTKTVLEKKEDVESFYEKEITELSSLEIKKIAEETSSLKNTYYHNLKDIQRFKDSYIAGLKKCHLENPIRWKAHLELWEKELNNILEKQKAEFFSSIYFIEENVDSVNHKIKEKITGLAATTNKLKKLKK